MKQRFETISEAQLFLLKYSPEKMDGETYTLGRMKLLMKSLGNPQHEYQVIHIAGTSGKTSTAYYTRALLEAAGFRTGMTISPHIVSLTERVQIAGEPLSELKFVNELERFVHLIEQLPDCKPTYFELMIGFAFWQFARSDVDIAVVETGLGGTLDATNVVTRSDKLCVITPIGLDHTQILGGTLAEIASQKAGIIGAKQHVYTAEQESAAFRIIEQACKRNYTTLHAISASADLPTLPLFQRSNFALAHTVVADLLVRADGKPLSASALDTAARKSPPGRFEVYDIDGTTVVLDGAHNPQKIQALLDALAEQQIKQNDTWLVAFIDAPDTKIDTCIELLPTTAQLFSTEFELGQDIKARKSVPASELQKKMIALGSLCYTENDYAVALQRALDATKGTLIITGSLYLVSLLRPHLIKLVQ